MILSRLVKKWAAFVGAFVAVPFVAVAAGPVFSEAPDSPVMLDAVSLDNTAVGDVNGDGAVDLVIPGSTSSQRDFWDVWLGDGAGRFAKSGKTINAPSNVAFSGKIRLVDVNNDGRLDMVSAGFGDGGYAVLVWGGNGDGSFTPYRGYYGGVAVPYRQTSSDVSIAEGVSSAEGLAVADMNRDGNVDLVLRGERYVYVLLGAGDGTFKVSMLTNIGDILPADASIGTMTVVDWNKDGALDIVMNGSFMVGTSTNNPNGKGFRVFINDGTGRTYAQEGTALDAAVDVYAVADYNGDGKLDIVTDCVKIRFPYGVGHADLTGSGVHRLFTWGSVYKNNTGSINGLHVWPELSGLTTNVASIDVERSPLVFLNNGSGGFTKGGFSASVCDSIVATYVIDKAAALYPKFAEVNNDGKLDLVCFDNRYNNDNRVHVALNVGAGLFKPELLDLMPAGGVVGKPFRYVVNTTGSRPITMDASGLPAGLSLSGNTIAGTPSSAGRKTVTVKATNSAGSDSATLYIEIKSPDVNKPPVVNAGPDAGNINVGETYRLSGSGTDDGLPADPGRLTIRWKVLSESLEDNVVFDDPRSPTTGVRFSNYNYAGAYKLVLVADDGQYASCDEVLITVNKPATSAQRIANCPTYLYVDEGAQVSFEASIVGDISTSPLVRIERVSGDSSVVVITKELKFGPARTLPVWFNVLKDIDRENGFAILKLSIVQPGGGEDPFYKNVFVEIRDLYSEDGGGGGGAHGPGDVNGDGVVNQLDLSEVVGNFGKDYR